MREIYGEREREREREIERRRKRKRERESGFHHKSLCFSLCASQSERRMKRKRRKKKAFSVRIPNHIFHTSKKQDDFSFQDNKPH